MVVRLPAEEPAEQQQVQAEQVVSEAAAVPTGHTGPEEAEEEDILAVAAALITVLAAAVVRTTVEQARPMCQDRSQATGR